MISKDEVNKLPKCPGVYIFRDKSSRIIYIGKAKSLKDRVRYYTYSGYNHSKRTRRLIKAARSVEFIACGSELEALLLESRLIKENLPEYNVAQRRYRDFPFIKITLNEQFPRVFTTWEIRPDGAKYIGPYPNQKLAEDIVDAIHKLFPIRKCGEKMLNRKRHECLNYDIRRCAGPCMNKVTEPEYRSIINKVIKLLCGRGNHIIGELEARMNLYALKLQFEKARIIRDQIQVIKDAILRRRFQVNPVDNNNVVTVYPSRYSDSVELFFIKKGLLVGQRSIVYRDKTDEEIYQELSSCLEEFFFQRLSCEKVFDRVSVDAMNIISRWLYRHRRDQAFVYIKRGRNQVETMHNAVKEIERIIRRISDNRLNDSKPRCKDECSSLHLTFTAHHSL